MKNHCIVAVADLACLKLYRMNRPSAHEPRLELIDHFTNEGAHDKLSDAVSDASGRFGRGGARGVSGKGTGERHHLREEHRRRLVRRLADQLGRSLARSGATDVYLAASREIHNQLVEELDPGLRALIVQTVPADLTHTEATQLMSHF